MPPKWGNIFNNSEKTRTKYNVPVRLVPSLVVQCTVFDKNNYRVKAIVSSMQPAKPRKRYTMQQQSHASCINIYCYLILLWLVVFKFYMQTIFNSNFHLDAKGNKTISRWFHPTCIELHIAITGNMNNNILHPSIYTQASESSKWTESSEWKRTWKYLSLNVSEFFFNHSHYMKMKWSGCHKSGTKK